MNQQEIEQLKSDFRQWSGGFPPESADQITVYLDYAALPLAFEDWITVIRITHDPCA